MGNMITPIKATRFNSRISFGDSTQKAATIQNGNQNQTKHKKQIATVSLLALLALGATSFFAFTRGKEINTSKGKEAKFTSNITEGFKSFFGKNKKAYEAIVNKKNTAGSKTEKKVESIAVKKLEQIIKKENLSNNPLSGDINLQVYESVSKLDNETASAMSDKIIKDLITADGTNYYESDICNNICTNLGNIKKCTLSQIKWQCKNNPNGFIKLLRKSPNEFENLAPKLATA